MCGEATMAFGVFTWNVRPWSGWAVRRPSTWRLGRSSRAVVERKRNFSLDTCAFYPVDWRGHSARGVIARNRISQGYWVHIRRRGWPVREVWYGDVLLECYAEWPEDHQRLRVLRRDELIKNKQFDVDKPDKVGKLVNCSENLSLRLVHIPRGLQVVKF